MQYVEIDFFFKARTGFMYFTVRMNRPFEKLTLFYPTKDLTQFVFKCRKSHPLSLFSSLVSFCFPTHFMQMK